MEDLILRKQPHVPLIGCVLTFKVSVWHVYLCGCVPCTHPGQRPQERSYVSPATPTRN